MSQQVFQSRQTSVTQKFNLWRSQLSEKISEVHSNPIAYTFYAIFWIVSKPGVLPCDVTLYGRGYTRITPVYGVRRWFSVVLSFDVFIYAIFMVYNSWREDLHFINKDGSVTIDALILAAAIALMVTALTCAKLLLYSQDGMITVRDQLNVLFHSVSEKHLQGQQLYQLYSKEFSLLIMAAFFPFVILMVPCLFGILLFTIRGSPLTLTYYTVRDSLWMYVILAHDWIVLNFGALYIVGTCASLFEGILAVSFFIRTLRKPDLQNLTWNHKLNIHAFLEIAVEETNRTLGVLAPFFVADAFLLSCVSLSVAFEIVGNSWTDGVPVHTFAILLACILVSVGTVMCTFCALRSMEILNMESNAFVRELQVERCAREKQRQRVQGGIQLVVLLPRYFRRRHVAAKLSIFMVVESGLGISFLEAVSDYTVQLILMVDGRQPVMILLPRVLA